jgi:hypothetical protein
MSKLINTKQELIHGHMVTVRVYAQDKTIDNLSLTKKYYARLKGVTGGMYMAKERNLKTTKEVR